MIDVSGGDKIPRKGGPGISQSDLLIVNKVRESMAGGCKNHGPRRTPCDSTSLDNCTARLSPLACALTSHADQFAYGQTDLAPHVGASLEVMRRDAAVMRESGPTLFTSVRNKEGVQDVVDAILGAWRASGGAGKKGNAKV